jgi:hypothetical protein
LIFGDIPLPTDPIDLSSFFDVSGTITIDPSLVDFTVFFDGGDGTGTVVIDVFGDQETAFVENTSEASSVNVLNNVPEPTTLALFGIGLFGLAGMRRRRKAA